MSLLSSLKDLKKQYLLNRSRVFAARVVNNVDPLKVQRVQFRIQKVHRGISDAQLPWASPVFPSMQGNNQIGSINIPVVGSTIVVEYIDDYSIIYKGTFNTDTTKIEELTTTNYPHCYGFTDRSGNKFLTNTESNTVTFTHVSGANISISNDGAVTIKAAQALNLEGASLSIKTTGATTISCSAFNVNTDNMALKSKGPLLQEGASLTLASGAAITANAATFAMNAVFSLVPTTGWATPPVAAAASPSAVITPPGPVTPRTRPTIPGFSNQTNY